MSDNLRICDMDPDKDYTAENILKEVERIRELKELELKKR